MKNYEPKVSELVRRIKAEDSYDTKAKLFTQLGDLRTEQYQRAQKLAENCYQAAERFLDRIKNE
ncbi:hypothetical protein HN385_03575 [archaeon]|nr:hypothetical protein [archaeon]MBT3451211.1 hypothetical protein [archaeon]MBT6869777.1 hypothetical protein [archaeon]MBT7192732.1 hypothetical protein [archaeon]MBT7380757.1 hypothetical protein [archaeon]